MDTSSCCSRQQCNPMEEEHARRVCEDRMCDVRDQLLSQADRAATRQMEEQERQERCCAERMCDVRDQMMSHVHRNSSRQLEEEERQNRCSCPAQLTPQQMERKAMLQEQLLRKSSENLVKQAEEEERQRRIAEERMFDVRDQMMSEVHRSASRLLEEDERMQRCTCPTELTTQQMERKAMLQEQLLRKSSENLVKQAEEEERARRVAEERMFDVRDQMMSEVHRTASRQLEEAERQDRCNCGETLTAEQLERKAMLQEQLLRKSSENLVKQAEEEERTRRVVEDKMHDVRDQMMSEVHRSASRQLELEEQARRVRESDAAGSASCRSKINESLMTEPPHLRHVASN